MTMPAFSKPRNDKTMRRLMVLALALGLTVPHPGAGANPLTPEQVATLYDLTLAEAHDYVQKRWPPQPDRREQVQIFPPASVTPATTPSPPRAQPTVDVQQVRFGVAHYQQRAEARGWTVLSNPGLSHTHWPSRTVNVNPHHPLRHHILAHELGHVIDMTVMTEAERGQWMIMRGWDPATDPYYGGGNDRQWASGEFAEAAGALIRRGTPLGVRPFTIEQMVFVQSIINRL